MKLEDAKIGMKVKAKDSVYADWGIGTITAIGEKVLLVKFEIDNPEYSNIIKLETDVEPRYVEEISYLPQYTIILDCKGDDIVHGLMLIDGEEVCDATTVKRDSQAFGIDKAMQACFDALLKTYKNN